MWPLVLATSLLSDVTFVVEGKPVRAHRVMVAARCPRLAALLAFHRRCVRWHDPAKR